MLMIVQVKIKYFMSNNRHLQDLSGYEHLENTLSDKSHMGRGKIGLVFAFEQTCPSKMIDSYFRTHLSRND
jgi:hypothetical protein